MRDSKFKPISRRKFISLSVSLLLSASNLLASAPRVISLRPHNVKRSRKLVIVQMSGGNDGLNTVVPYSAGRYYELRPNISIKPKDTIPLTSALGLHPNLTALKELYEKDKLAIALGVGYPRGAQTHFRSTEIWQTAEPHAIAIKSWIGRYLERVYAKEENTANCHYRAINVEPMFPRSLSAQGVLPSPQLSNCEFNHAHRDCNPCNRQKQIELFNQLYLSFDIERPSNILQRELGWDTRQASCHYPKIEDDSRSFVRYPDSGFGRGMRLIAQMIAARVQATIYSISFGGFDTHRNQLTTHGALLKQCMDALSAFQTDLERQHLDEDVIVMVFSEFGRRPNENTMGGTEHGTAGPVFLIGSAIQGGLYGEYPSLTKLDDDQLKYSIDFRSIYATILDHWFQVDSEHILAGRYENLAFI